MKACLKPWKSGWRAARKPITKEPTRLGMKYPEPSIWNPDLELHTHRRHQGKRSDLEEGLEVGEGAEGDAGPDAKVGEEAHPEKVVPHLTGRRHTHASLGA